jgi:YbbR domain-containing protein
MKNKLIYALLSFVIALGLWFYVIAVVSPESEEIFYNIPVVLQNESVLNEKGFMIATQGKPTVTLRLRGNRSDLNKLTNSDILLSVDMSKINRVGKQYLSIDTDFPGSFADNAFEVLSYAPDRISLDIVEWAMKEVDVKVEFTGTVPADYIVYKDDYILDQNKVTVSGPKEIVDKITHAKVEVALDNQISSISKDFTYTLCDEAGEPVETELLTTDVTEVNLTVKIQRVKDLQLVVNVTYGGGATEDTTSIVFSQENIKVSGSEEALATLGDTLLLDTIDVAEILAEETREYDIILPAEVDNLSGLTTVTVTISFPELKTKELPISNITVKNVPRGMVVKDIGTKVCNVTLRGSQWQIDNITAKDVEIRVDLSNATEGTELYKAEIVVTNPSFPSVGVVSSYTVAVELAMENAN